MKITKEQILRVNQVIASLPIAYLGQAQENQMMGKYFLAVLQKRYFFLMTKKFTWLAMHQ